MLLIWGFRSTVAHLATLMLTCGACRTPAAHHVRRMRRWFTLFFIPVIPYKTVYFTTCTYCGVDLKLTQEEATRLEQAANGPVGPPERQLAALDRPAGSHPGAQAPAAQQRYQPQRPPQGAQAPAGQHGYQQPHPGAQRPAGPYGQQPYQGGQAPGGHQAHQPGHAHQPPRQPYQQPGGYQGQGPAPGRGDWRG
jgi:hypothetical protein